MEGVISAIISSRRAFGNNEGCRSTQSKSRVTNIQVAQEGSCYGGGWMDDNRKIKDVNAGIHHRQSIIGGLFNTGASLIFNIQWNDYKFSFVGMTMQLVH